MTQPDVPTIETALLAVATPERAESEKVYLKSDLKHLGASVPAIRQVAKAVQRQHPELPHDRLVLLVEALWARPVHECRMVAVELLDLYGNSLTAADGALLERLLRESRTWALVDSLAARVVGPLVEREPELGERLDRWVVDEDVWLRRSALLALLLPLRRGDGDMDRFSRYADQLLEDPSFWVRKAIGWVLRDTGRKRPDLVAEWLLPRAHRAAALTVREAVKPLSQAQRDAILAARGA